MLPPDVQAAFTLIMNMYWKFLSVGWPVLEKNKYHRTDTKEVKDIGYVKTTVLQRLGYIPVFFFLVEFFAKDEYPGPYRGVDKGLLVLYQLLTGVSIAQMARFIPSSSYHAISNAFYVKHGEKLNSMLDKCLATMFSSTKGRIICARHNNPEGFKHVTLMLDGHDSRATYINGGDRSMFYSYKLKKSGFRTQVCIDVNGMVLFVSNSAPCASNNDGSMLAGINLKRKVGKYDCIALDGGYTLFVDRVIDTNPYLGKHNFVLPIRKQRGVSLTVEEAKYNKVFGSFRSMIESTFGDLGALFERFNGKSVIRVTDMATFTVQFKLGCCLYNLKRFVEAGHVSYTEQHTAWMQPGFDYPSGVSSRSVYDVIEDISTITDKAEEAQAIGNLQEHFLSLDINDEEEDLPVSEDEELPDTHYDVECIVKHRGPKHRREYFVKWVGYSKEANSWLKPADFDGLEIVQEYENLVATNRQRARK